MNDYSMYDLADEFNTQLFIVRDKEKFNKLLIEEHFKQIEEMDKLQQRIDKAIEFIEDNYYSLNTRNIDCIGFTTDKMLKVRNILKGEDNEQSNSISS